jgi:hypothetical protein
MTDLLTALRDEAVTLVDHEVPEIEQVRPILGALIKRLERVADDLPGLLDEPPEAEPVDYNEHQAVAEVPGHGAPPPQAAAQGTTTIAAPEASVELQAAKAMQVELASKIAELEAAQVAQGTPAAGG